MDHDAGLILEELLNCFLDGIKEPKKGKKLPEPEELREEAKKYE